MATVFTHPAIAIALLPWFKGVLKSKLVLVVGILFTIIPDADVIAFNFGIPYSHTFGHRGFTHSLFFAAFVSVIFAWPLSKYKKLKMAPICLFLFLCMASHGVLDALTNGGLGIAFFSPFSNERYFFPFHPVEVSTLSIKRFFNGQGIAVIISELKLIWLPCIIICMGRFIWLRNARKK